MNGFYLGLIIAAVVLALFMSYATYDTDLIQSSYRLAMQQNENKFNPDVEWIGPKEQTIFDASILEDIETAALLA
jgi:hypothetical protein